MKEKPTEHAKGRNFDPIWNEAYRGESFQGFDTPALKHFEETDEEDEEAQ